MENINFRGIPTSLFLNGPKVGIVTDPQDQVEVIGFATFTGIATATAGAGGTMDSGIGIGASIVFKWYLDGTEVQDINVDDTSRATILGFSTATGFGSTITFNSLVAADSGKEVYFTADFVPTAYSQPVGTAVTVGSARSTANAINDPLQSQSAVVTILPIIEVTSQPSSGLIAINNPLEFSVSGKTTPGDGSVKYQWQLNENDLSDGENQSIEGFGSGSGKFTITRGSETPFVVNASELSSYDDFVTGEIYTIVPDSDIETIVFAFGADGDTNARTGGSAGKGGIMQGPFTFLKDQTYKLVIGKVGTANFEPELRHGAGGKSTGGGAKSGGGFTGLFKDEVTHENAILIAGGGGSAAKGDYRPGGNGGGLDAVDNAAPWSTDSGGNQEQGGLGFYDTRDGQGTYGTQYRYMTGKKFFGGFNNGGANNNNGGAGGGGYYGGGAGRADSNYSPGPYGGGGGSGFSDPDLVDNAQSSTGGADYDRQQQARVAGEGQFRIEIVNAAKSANFTVTGAQTEKLTITSDASINGVIRCKLTATGVQQSPVFSKSVSYYVLDARNIMNIEQYNYSDGTAILSSSDLSNGSLSISYDSHPGNVVCLYAGEKDLEVEMDMYGGKGVGFDDPGGTNAVENFRWTSGFEGGGGGYSKIRFTMKKGEEYILAGLFTSVNAPFLYRKGTLIACVGEGGWGGHYGRGGFGGGIGIAGEDGHNRHAGEGAAAIPAGTLPSNGIIGSRYRDIVVPVTPDTVERNDTEAGRTIPCARGVYWREQGKEPCEDLGTIKFRTPDGTEISNSASISRGYKSGYNIIQTGGTRAGSDGGNGGNGAAGGTAGNSSGGGGGTGYTDGSVTVVKSTLGETQGNARINIKLSVGNFFIDEEGRILILSTQDNRDPRTLTKTTEMVNYNDNACIDDARWQEFLDLARDGTQDYRLTATQNNSTVKIVNATEKNIYKMMNGNALTLRDSLTGWVDSNYAYELLALAWDETSNDGMSGYGSDYSILSWSPSSAYGYGFYGGSSVPFFTPTTYGWKGGVDFWILPPGVPDFS